MTSPWVFTHRLHVLIQWYPITNGVIEAIFPKKIASIQRKEPKTTQSHAGALQLAVF